MSGALDINTALMLGPAGDPCSEQPEPCVFFSAQTDPLALASHIFDVAAGGEGSEVMQIMAFDMAPDDVIVVEQVFGAGSGEYFAPIQFDGTRLALDSSTNRLLIPTSGRFRLRYTAGTPGKALVVCAPTDCCHATLVAAWAYAAKQAVVTPPVPLVYDIQTDAFGVPLNKAIQL